MAVVEHRPSNEGATYIPPNAAKSLAGFRDWYASDEFPEEGRICYLGGELFIDMGHERISSHVALKTVLTEILSALIRELRTGRFLGDGVRVVNENAELSSEPDACFFSWSAVKDGRVHLQKSSDGNDVIEIVGSPEMVLEVVSSSSVRKDKALLPELYHKAAIPEYWLIDARKEPLKFQILRDTPEGYVPASDHGGWLSSRVFGRDFRLERTEDQIGLSLYTVHVRPTE
jgi:Uma2 family endonuclease